MCKDFFGDDFTKAHIESLIANTNAYYGGLGLDVENVVFVHGSNDPWYKLGLQSDLNENSPVIVIKGKDFADS